MIAPQRHTRDATAGLRVGGNPDRTRSSIQCFQYSYVQYSYCTIGYYLGLRMRSPAIVTDAIERLINSNLLLERRTYSTVLSRIVLYYVYNM